MIWRPSSRARLQVVWILRGLGETAGELTIWHSGWLDHAVDNAGVTLARTPVQVKPGMVISQTNSSSAFYQRTPRWSGSTATLVGYWLCIILRYHHESDCTSSLTALHLAQQAHEQFARLFLISVVSSSIRSPRWRTQQRYRNSYVMYVGVSRTWRRYWIIDDEDLLNPIDRSAALCWTNLCVIITLIL